MREILFRGKKFSNREWVEGFLTPNNYDTYTKPSIGDAGQWCIHRGLIEVYLVRPETVGQYTGFNDKNGKKIFEGDIVNVYDSLTYKEFVGYVDFKDASFRIVEEFLSHFRWIDYMIEVIGNVYDNPELLEQEDAQ